jgi:uncharacterized Zn finger protein (UPF0148 family)
MSETWTCPGCGCPIVIDETKPLVSCPNCKTTLKRIVIVVEGKNA